MPLWAVLLTRPSRRAGCDARPPLHLIALSRAFDIDHALTCLQVPTHSFMSRRRAVGPPFAHTPTLSRREGLGSALEAQKSGVFVRELPVWKGHRRTQVRSGRLPRALGAQEQEHQFLFPLNSSVGKKSTRHSSTRVIPIGHSSSLLSLSLTAGE